MPKSKQSKVKPPPGGIAPTIVGKKHGLPKSISPKTPSPSSSSHSTSRHKTGVLRRVTPQWENPESIPAGYSVFDKPHLKVTGDFMTGVTVNFHVPLCPVGIGANTAVDGMLLPQSTTSFGGTLAQTEVTNLAYNPVRMLGAIPGTLLATLYDSYQDNDFVPLIAQCFSKYRINGGHVTFRYEPQSNTSSGVRYNLSMTNDPLHPVQGMGAINTLLPGAFNESAVRAGMNCISFPGWLPWQAEWPIDPKTEYYTYYPTEAGGTTVAQSARFSFPFCLFGIANSATSGGVRVDGILYLGGSFTFMDPTPIQNAGFGPKLSWIKDSNSAKLSRPTTSRALSTSTPPSSPTSAPRAPLLSKPLEPVVEGKEGKEELRDYPSSDDDDDPDTRVVVAVTPSMVAVSSSSTSSSSSSSSSSTASSSSSSTDPRLRAVRRASVKP